MARKIEIERLEEKMAQHGEAGAISLCDRALAGDREAMKKVEEMLEANRRARASQRKLLRKP